MTEKAKSRRRRNAYPKLEENRFFKRNQDPSKGIIFYEVICAHKLPSQIFKFNKRMVD